MASGGRARRARVAVVGAGLMGRWHAHAAERVGATVAAIVDPRYESAQALAARHTGASAVPDLDAALSEGDVDVVHVCTPVASHAPLAHAALAAGCHALVEKPLASSFGEAEQLVAEARARHLALSPVHQLPFQPGFRRLLEQRARLGELVRVAYRTASAGGEGRSPAERRALLVEILPHPASLLHRLFPSSLDVEALEVVRFTEGDLDLSGSLEGTRLEVTVSLRARPTRNELEVVGTRGTALADLFHGYAFVDSSGVSRSSKALRPFRLGGRQVAHAAANLGGRALRREPAYPGLRELVRRFHDAALGGGELPVPEEETLAAARLADRVRDALS